MTDRFSPASILDERKATISDILFNEESLVCIRLHDGTHAGETQVGLTEIQVVRVRIRRWDVILTQISSKLHLWMC
jgi:hypothetical protein